MINFLTLE